MFDTKERIQSLGNLAESVVKNYFEQNGSVVEMATDPFDSSMDMTIDGVRAEVKFQTIYHFFKSYDQEKPYPAFTVAVDNHNSKLASNQLDKCLHAPRWIIVQNPSSRLKETTIKLWEAPPPGQRRFKFSCNSKDRRRVAGFNMNMFKLIVDIDDRVLYNRIKSLDISQFS